MKKKAYYITTPIYYPNDNLHLGHTYTTIVADTLKKFKQMQGYDVFFTTGTDEHGQKLEEAAKKAGKKPLEYIDPIVASAKELWKKLDIRYDAFVRSTDPQHEKNVANIFQQLYDKGDIYKSVYFGSYCVSCEAFWTEAQLMDGKCPDCGREVHYHEEESYFFRLSKYQDALLKHYEDNPEFILPVSRKNEMINNFLKQGLDDLSVSRSSFDWGVKVPFDDNHIIYVWIDALSCYLTGVGYGYDQELFEKYWPADVHFVGKEIVRFHTIIWPALLMALDLPLPKRIFGHGWILFDEDKMSKSKGNVVYAEPIIDLYGIDALKYFVLREFTFGADGNFTSEKLMQRMNSDLANDLGNLVSRTAAMVEKYYGGIIPEPQVEQGTDAELKELATSILDEVEELMDHFHFSGALEAIWKLIRRTNKYIDETTPWILGNNQDFSRLSTVLFNLCDCLRIISILIAPFMGETTRRIQEQMGLKGTQWEEAKTFGLTKSGIRVAKKDNLFPRLDIAKEMKRLAKENDALFQLRRKAKVAEMAEDKKEVLKTEEPANTESQPDMREEPLEITIDQFSQVKMKIGKIIDCQPHPKADRLLVSQVRIGEETRQIVSGIRKYYQPEELIGKNVVVVTNLKPVKLRGVESRGMLLAAVDGDNLSILTTLSDMESGAEVS